MVADPWMLGASELGRAYAGKKTDPVEVVRCYMNRIVRLDPKLNSFVALAPDLEKQANESLERLVAGEPRSALEGVPIAIKDNLKVSGMPASWGSPVFSDEICSADELPIRRLREAGAILLGKTNTPEFAVEGYTANQTFGVTRNPWRTELTPGGSSGGAVAAVAAGLAAAAIGTDGGGSIRRPAAHTGLYGLKPTIGRIPRSGGLPQVLLDFEVVGPLARNVADLRLLFSCLCGPDRSDPRSRLALTEKCRKPVLRILYVERFGDHPCDRHIRSSVAAAAERLSAMGHEVACGPVPFDLDAIAEHWGGIGQTGLAYLLDCIPDVARKASAKYLDMAEQGSRLSAPELYATLEVIRVLRSQVSEAFADWDVIMTPTTAAQPWPAEQAYPPVIDGHEVGPRGHAIYTGWVNAAGHPAVNIPADPDPDGLPIGFQLVGDIHSEEMLLDLAAAHEALGHGWQWPAIADLATA